MELSIISIVLVIIVAFLAGMEGILDQFQFHQPLVACTLIGLVTGNFEACLFLGGSLQMMAMGWANIGAAVAPDAALASVASAIILVLAINGKTDHAVIEEAAKVAIGIAIPLAVAGLFLTMIVRTLAVPIVHLMDSAAIKGNIRQIEFLQILAICMQGLRIAIPAAALVFIPNSMVSGALESMPKWLTAGMAIGGGMVVAVGYAMVINMMANKEVWPFFIIGFVVAAMTQLTLIAIGALGIALALIYLNLSERAGSSGGGSSGDSLDDILNDY